MRPPDRQFGALCEACPLPLTQELARIGIDRHCSDSERGSTRAAVSRSAATVVRHEVMAIHNEPNEPFVDNRDSAVRVVRDGEATEENLRIVAGLQAARQRQRA